MPFTAQYDPEKRFIRVAVHGELTTTVLKEIASVVSQIIAQTGCELILNDLRKASLADSVSDVYSMPQIAENAGVVPTIKRALVVGSLEKDFHFLETVFRNQGNNVRMFSNMEEAGEWLSGNDE